MAKKNSLKRALIFGATSMALSASMFVGTTFAWFTDSVTSSNNIIKSGNLDVELYYQNDETSDWVKVGQNTNVFKESTLWEPGHTEVVQLKVVNEGSLALKYQLGVNVAGEVGSVNVYGEEFKLSDYIQYGIVAGENNYATRLEAIQDAEEAGVKALKEAYNSGTQKLVSKAETVVTMVVYMPTTVENEANAKTGAVVPTINLGINLVATQVEAEDDSFDDKYDEDAWHPSMTVYNASDLKDALVNGGNITVVGKIDGDGVMTPFEGYPNETVEYYVAGENVSVKGGKYTLDETAKYGIYVDTYTNGGGNIALSDMDITANSKWSFVIENAANGVVAVSDVDITAQSGAGLYGVGGKITLDNVNVNHLAFDPAYSDTPWGATALAAAGAADMTINSGSYYGSTYGLYAYSSGATITINGGTFKAPVVVAADAQNGANTYITINGGNFDGKFESVNVWGGSEALITINGGNFTNFSTTANKRITIKGGVFDCDVSNWVADGYQAVANGDGTFRVVLKLENGNQLTPVANYNNLFTDGTNYYVYDAIGLISMNRLWAANPYSNNMWNKSYNVMADIDATGFTWNNVFVVVGNNANDGFVFDGHGNTITGLNINGGLFSGTPNGGNAGTKPGVVKDITFDGVNVNGDHFAAVLWNSTYGDLLVESVNVINSTIVGNCNVAALVGGTSQESGDVTVEFKNCNVSNNKIVANGKAGQDPNGAAAYISRAFAQAFVKFAGNNVSQNNQITNKNGLVGGGIYGYTTYVSGTGFMGTGSCDTFTDWNGISAVSMNVDESATPEENGTALAEAINASSGNTYLVLPTGEYKMPSVGGNKEITIVGTKDTVIDNTMGSYMEAAKVSFEGVTIKGSTGMANGNGSDYAALYTPNVTYTNCTFDGPFRIGRDGAKFINCKFTNLGNDYVWTYGNDVEFIGCTFETVGKAILIYSDGGNEVSKVTVKDCVFKATQGATAYAISNQNCAAIEIQNYGNGVDLVVSGNTVETNFSGLWRIKAYHENRTAVIVNGVTYTQTALDGRAMTVSSDRVATFD